MTLVDVVFVDQLRSFFLSFEASHELLAVEAVGALCTHVARSIELHLPPVCDWALLKLSLHALAIQNEWIFADPLHHGLSPLVRS